MMTTPERSEAELDSVLMLYVEGRERRTGPTLFDLLEQYPQHASGLLEFAELYEATVDADEDVLENDQYPELERILTETMAQALRRMPKTLSARGRELGKCKSAIAGAIGIPLEVFGKIDMRGLSLGSLPVKLISRLADVLDLSVAQVIAYLQQPQPQGAHYARTVPIEPLQESFDAALERAKTTPEMRVWLAEERWSAINTAAAE
ncbi:MAG: hypothetical protein M1296_05640 [Chloroflexi bacterium]|nr:hypothetical protein [Chloroflexota bacterium]